MPKKPKVNKSKAVREFMAANPNAGPKEISDTLKKQGIKISPAFVSTVKTKMRKGKRRRKAADVLAEKTGVGVPEIKMAFALLRQCGGVTQAKEAMAAAIEIQKVL